MAAVFAFFYDLCYVLPVCLIVFGVGKPFLFLPEKSNVPLLFTVLLPVVLCSVRHIKNKYRFLPPGIFAVGLVCRFLAVDREKRSSFLESRSYLLWILLITVAGYILGRLMATYTTVKRVTLFLFIAGGIALMCTGTKTGKAPVVGGFLMILFLISEEVQRNWEKSGFSEMKAHLVCIAPFLLLLTCLVYRIPAPQKTYDWGFAVNLWQRAGDLFEQLSAKFLFRTEEYGEIGFSENGEVGGRLKDSDEEVLLFTDKGRSPERVYLTGAVFDRFDGRGWSAENGLQEDIRLLDTLELMCAVYKKDAMYAVDYYQNSYARLESRFHSTHYLFLPQKTFLSGAKLGGLSYVETWENVKTKKRLPYRSEYPLSFLRLNQDTPLFRELLLTAEPITEEEWGDFLFTKRLVAENELSYSHYIEYKEILKASYAETPELSEEVKTVLDRLYEGAANDLERLERLEKWLCSMKYSHSAEVLPESVTSPETFMDYFLLEEQEGYCVHYATAFALAARALGLPVRYVQGFCFDRNASDNGMVKAERAHAWPEVYFDNVGWIMFEPTPGYHKSEGWSLRSRETSESPKGNGTSFVPVEVIAGQEKEKPETSGDGRNSFDARVVVIPVACCAIFLVSYLGAAGLVTGYRYRKMERGRKVLYLCGKCGRMLQRLGYRKKEGETLEEYGCRLKNDFPESITDFIPVYERTVYSETEPSTETLSCVERAYKELFSLLWKRKTGAGRGKK